MNIEEKTKLAHEYFRDAMAFIRKEDINHEFDLIIEESWKYADAMEAEAEKRIKAKAEKDAKDAKVFFEELTNNEDGSCKHFHTTSNRGECFDCGENLNSTNSMELEWQPDWSVAPSWAEYFAVDENTEGWFFIQEPTIDVDGCWYCVGGSYMAFSHDYQGNWEDSLRKRPE